MSVSLWIVVYSVYLIFPWKSCVWTLAPCKRGLYLAGWLWGEDEFKSEAAAVPTPSEVKTASWPLPLATDWEALPTLLGSATVKGTNISGIMRLGTGITEGKIGWYAVWAIWVKASCASTWLRRSIIWVSCWRPCASETSSRYSPSCPCTLKLAIGLGGELTVGLTWTWGWTCAGGGGNGGNQYIVQGPRCRWPSYWGGGPPALFDGMAIAAIETVVCQHQVTHNNKLTHSNKLQISSDTKHFCAHQGTQNKIQKFLGTAHHVLHMRYHEGHTCTIYRIPKLDALHKHAEFKLRTSHTHWHTHAHTYNQVFAWWTECRNIHVSVSLRLKAPSPLGVLHLWASFTARRPFECR